MQLLFLLTGYMAFVATATITLVDLQPIALFSDSCAEAYSTPILNCDYTMFAPFDGDSTCSRACMTELNTLAGSIQKACQTDGVKPNTVIAHAFQGDLANWLCARGTFSTQQPTVVSGTATNAKATSTTAASTSTTTSMSTTAQDSSSTDDSSTTTESTSESTTLSSNSTSSMFTTFSTTTTSIIATTSHAASSSTSSRPKQTSNFIGDSTPFDQTAFANYAQPVKHDKKNMLLLPFLVPTVTSLIVIGVGAWMY